MLPQITAQPLAIYVATEFPSKWKLGRKVCDPPPSPDGRWLDSALVRWEQAW